jgi:hypothetical protein
VYGCIGLDLTQLHLIAQGSQHQPAHGYPGAECHFSKLDLTGQHLRRSWHLQGYVMVHGRPCHSTNNIRHTSWLLLLHQLLLIFSDCLSHVLSYCSAETALQRSSHAANLAYEVDAGQMLVRPAPCRSCLTGLSKVYQSLEAAYHRAVRVVPPRNPFPFGSGSRPSCLVQKEACPDGFRVGATKR